MKTPFELADIIKQYGLQLSKQHRLNPIQKKVLCKITQCRTASLGGHEEKCDCCGKTRYSYNSCGDRHCPKCQSVKQALWIDKLKKDTLPIKHYHIVFTIPHCLNNIFLWNNRKFYSILFKTVWSTLQTFSYTHFGVEGGAICVLHTWGQNLSFHPHIHCIVPAAGYSLKGKWENIGSNGKFLYPVHQLSKMYKGKLMDSIKRELRKENKLDDFNVFIQDAYQKKWVVHCEPALAKAEHVIQYLGQYTHRVAITNHRIMNIHNDKITFMAKDYRDRANQKPVTLTAIEFLRRFCMHILPLRFVKTRFFGIYNPTVKRNLNLMFTIEDNPEKMTLKKKHKTKKSNVEIFEEITGYSIFQCPFCKKGTMYITRELQRIRGPDYII